MVQVQLARGELAPAILAAVLVPEKDVLAREADFVPRQPVEMEQEHHPWNSYPKGRCADEFFVGLGRYVLPVVPVIRRIVRGHRPHLSLVKKAEGLADGRDLDRLVETVENENASIGHDLNPGAELPDPPLR